MNAPRQRPMLPVEPTKSFLLATMEVTPTGCWQWTGRLTYKGYGTFSRGRNYVAHRVAYETFIGAIPAGLTIDHLCRNRACINPDHLEPVTAGENTLRGFGPPAKNARVTHCSRGHAFDGTDDRGWRTCSICHRDNARESWRRRRGIHAKAKEWLERQS